MKNLYLIIGPSGSGKTRLAEGLSEQYGMKSVESYTTRPPRYSGETGHLFVTDEEFDALGELCAYTEYNGYRYGVTKDILDESDIYVIDPAGALYLADHYSGKYLRYIWLGTSPGVCYERMIARGDSEDMAQERVKNDEKAFGIIRLAQIRTKMSGNFFVTDNYTADQILDIVKRKIDELERFDGLGAFERGHSGLLEEE